ncbi:MAG: hypothetical protein Q4G68_00025 [Planctomycetia bacterium]|nr:hypothetical protein [Planctomycetia bacterium]
MAENPLQNSSLDEVTDFLDRIVLEEDDLRLLKYHLPRRLYALLGDEVLDWCFERFQAVSSEQDYRKFRALFEDFGYDVDGYPERFMRRLPAIIADATVSPRIRGVLAVGSVCHPVLSRNEETFTGMELVCRYCMNEVLNLPLSSGTVSPITCLLPTDCVPAEIDSSLIDWFSTGDNLFYSPARGFRRLLGRKKLFDRQRFFGRILQSLWKRRAALDDYAEGNLLLPESFLDQLVTENSKCAARFKQLGFDCDKKEHLKRALLSLWALDTPLYCEKLADCFVFKTRFLAVDPNVTESWCLHAVWSVIDRGRVAIERVALSNQSPVEPDAWSVNDDR